jgi:small-conductance mechanosensitive channel
MARTDGEASHAIEGMVAAFESLIEAGRGRLGRLGAVGEDWRALEAAIAAAGFSPFGLLLSVMAVAAVGLAADRLAAGMLAGRRFGRATRGLLSAAAALAAGGAVVALIGGGPGPGRRALFMVVLAVPISLIAIRLVTLILARAGRRFGIGPDLDRFSRMLSGVVAFGVSGVALLAMLRQFQAGPGLRDVVSTGLVILPVTVGGAFAYLRFRRAIASALAQDWAGEHRLRWLTRRWPAVAVCLLLAAFVVVQLAATTQTPVPGLVFMVTLAGLLLWPHLDAMLTRWAADGLDAEQVATPRVAARRTARPALAILLLGGLFAIWGGPVMAVAHADLTSLARTSVGICLLLLLSSFLWNILGVSVDRLLAREKTGSPDLDSTPRSRLGTLLPILAITAKIALAALTLLTALLALGVNVWPFVTGLSVFGLAIGFGSQTLVKDIVSGVFFLADDAFRLGEYIEISGAKGTVEKISVRSVSLRHPRGSIATIPYGQIQKIQNFSRDWVIEKLTFRVAFDTDVDKVKKIFKAIGQDLMQDEELAKSVLEPFKSQGIAAVEDNTLIIGGKFKALAGQQSDMRKAVLVAVQKAFRENGIQMVPRPQQPVANPSPG